MFNIRVSFFQQKGSCKKKKVKKKENLLDKNDRRERDSNPRYKKLVQRISNQSLSTTQPSLQPCSLLGLPRYIYILCVLQPNFRGKTMGLLYGKPLRRLKSPWHQIEFSYQTSDKLVNPSTVSQPSSGWSWCGSN